MRLTVLTLSVLGAASSAFGQSASTPRDPDRRAPARSERRQPSERPDRP
ncbi:MAG: hypothetical protein AVDCRST_MAG64-2029, partial [uncultured Phycisphaerae bacterium]